MFLGRMEPRNLAHYFLQHSTCSLQPRTCPCGGDSVLSGRSCVYLCMVFVTTVPGLCSWYSVLGYALNSQRSRGWISHRGRRFLSVELIPVCRASQMCPTSLFYRGLFFLGLEREADHSATSTAVVKNGRVFTYTPPYAFMVYTVTNLSLSYLTTLSLAGTFFIW